MTSKHHVVQENRGLGWATILGPYTGQEAADMAAELSSGGDPHRTYRSILLPPPLWVARLALQARLAVIEHRRDRERKPDRHRGCLWCEDGRLSHWASDARNFHGSELTDAALDLYERAYRRDMPVEVYDGPVHPLP